MAILSPILECVRDNKRIAARLPGDYAGRMRMLKAYIRLRWLSAIHNGSGEVTFLDYKVKYLNAEYLFQLFREIFINGFYDLPIGSESPHIIDCGSNIGMSIMFFKSKYPNARIIGFEPHPATYEVLSSNIERNDFQQVELFQLALSDRNGNIDLFVKDGDLGALDMSIVAGRSALPCKVPTDMLSKYVEGEVDLLKLDIEGAEELVLKDLEKEGKLMHFKRIVCEYHHHRDGSVDCLSETLALLERSGFGYQLDAYHHSGTKESSFQDILIYAYRKQY